MWYSMQILLLPRSSGACRLCQIAVCRLYHQEDDYNDGRYKVLHDTLVCDLIFCNCVINHVGWVRMVEQMVSNPCFPVVDGGKEH